MNQVARCACAGVIMLVALAVSTPRAAAQQSATGTFPRATSPGTWDRPDGGCSGMTPISPTTRTFALVPLELSGSGTFTVTVTRQGGGFIAVNLYQTSLPGTTGAAVCSNWTDVRAEGLGTVSVDLVCDDALCDSGLSVYDAVVSGENATDSGQFTFTISGGPPVVGTCSNDGVLSVTSQVALETGASYSTVYTPAALPASDIGCQLWVSRNVPSWITGIPASSSGAQTISYTALPNMTGMSRTATITIGTEVLTVTQPPILPCVFSISPGSASFSAAGGMGSFMLSTAAYCTWTASTNAGFVHLTTTSGTGPATINYSVDASVAAARMASITLEGQTHTVTQASGCSAVVTPTDVVDPSGAAGSTPISITQSDATCPWTASASASPWLSIDPSSGTGSATVNLTRSTNTGPARTGTADIAGTSVTVSQGSVCTIAVTPATAMLGAAAGTASFDVAAPAGCAWTLAPDQAWLTATMSGTGSATVSYNYAANTGPARTGSFRATLASTGAYAEHSIDQADRCSVTVAATQTVPTSAGIDSFLVTAATGCDWTTSTTAPWLSGITASGTGTATVTFDYAANPGAARSGVIQVTATSTGNSADHAVQQVAGCVAMLSEASAMLSAAGTSMTVDLTLSASDCAWTVSALAPWLMLDMSAGTGSATLTFSATPNVGEARTGSLRIAGQTFTVTQSSGCTVVLTPAAVTADANSSMQTVQLDTDPACSWTTAEALDWVSAAPTSGTGPASIVLSLDENPGPMRTGTFTVVASDTGDTRELTVSQAELCTVSLPVQAAGVGPAGGTSSFAVVTAAGCSYSVSSDAAWVSAQVTATGVEYTADTWDGAARSARLTVRSNSSDSSAEFTLSQADGCTLMLTPGNVRVAASGTSVSFEVSSGPGCVITAQTSSDFLSDVRVDGSTVSVQVAENRSAARTGMVEVQAADATGTFVIQQEAGEEGVGDAGVRPDAGGVQYLVGGGCNLMQRPRGLRPQAWLGAAGVVACVVVLRRRRRSR